MQLHIPTLLHESSRACPAAHPLECTKSSPWAQAGAMPSLFRRRLQTASADRLSTYTPRSSPTLKLFFSCTSTSVPTPVWLHHIHLF